MNMEGPKGEGQRSSGKKSGIGQLIHMDSEVSQNYGGKN